MRKFDVMVMPSAEEDIIGIIRYISDDLQTRRLHAIPIRCTWMHWNPWNICRTGTLYPDWRYSTRGNSD